MRGGTAVCIVLLARTLHRGNKKEFSKNLNYLHDMTGDGNRWVTSFRFQNMAVLLFLLLFTQSVHSENPYSFYLFENVEGTSKLFNQEIQLLEELKEYKSGLKVLQENMASIKFHIPKDLLNPIGNLIILYFRRFSNTFLPNLVRLDRLLSFLEFLLFKNYSFNYYNR